MSNGTLFFKLNLVIVNTNAPLMAEQCLTVCGRIHSYKTQLTIKKANKFCILPNSSFSSCINIARLHKWIVPQLSIRINYNGTWSILIQWLIGLW